MLTRNHRRASPVAAACALAGALCVLLAGNPTASGQQNRRVYRDRVVPHWSADGSRFWYRNDLAGGGREFVLVDAQAGTRLPAFDHAAVAESLAGAAESNRLPIDELDLDVAAPAIALIGPDGSWRWDAEKQTLTPLERSGDGNRPKPSQFSAPKNNSPASRPLRTGAESELTFDNRMQIAVEIFWISGDGVRTSYGKVAPGTLKHQHTFGGHRWSIVTAKGEALGEVVAEDSPTSIVIDGRPLATARPARRAGRGDAITERAGGGNGDRARVKSPDGKWFAVIENFNLKVVSADADEEMPLSLDGREDFYYSHLEWSPDSQRIVAFRTEPGDDKLVHLIRSSPEGGGRAQLESRPYALPGDRFPRHEVHIFSLSNQEHLQPDVDPFEHQWQRPRLRWSRDGQRFTYQQTDRGHGRLRLIEIRLADGDVRNLIDERAETFLWTAHTENQGFDTVNWLEQSDEIIYVTEKSGWRHLVLIDAISGEEKNAITSGQWVVRGIERIDEAQRQVWFRASGCFDQDPYLIHYGRVDFDGSNLTWLTRGDGTHTLEYSPDGRFVLDRYSRVDLPPVTELRRAADGELVCQLETADIERLEASGWSPPEVFHAKGRDGRTDIWGIICRPRDFDPDKKYPVIEDIYAGPHGSFVPKSFSPSQRYEDLTSLGFIVVKIDGMGTAGRSKAFHDVCWQNLKDAGLEDRILWMQAAAAQHPEMDLSRVGIYGTSAGGQNAAAALLFHPEFYRVGVAACGCHDNRMDKASWNEQWMGYPVGPQYSACSNIDNAHRLQGKLLLIVGEMDTNVPPESTLRFADALIKADKDFELLVIPNAGHGMGGRYGQRRMHDFFVRHLLDQ